MVDIQQACGALSPRLEGPKRKMVKRETNIKLIKLMRKTSLLNKLKIGQRYPNLGKSAANERNMVQLAPLFRQKTQAVA